MQLLAIKDQMNSSVSLAKLINFHWDCINNLKFLTVTDSTPKSTKERLKELPKFFKEKAKSICRKKILYKRVPILNWLPNYNTEDAVGDLVAGLTVGLTVIPQALAYAGIANLPAAYGLYGSFLGCFVYIFLGSCKDVPMGEFQIGISLRIVFKSEIFVLTTNQVRRPLLHSWHFKQLKAVGRKLCFFLSSLASLNSWWVFSVLAFSSILCQDQFQAALQVLWL